MATLDELIDSVCVYLKTSGGYPEAQLREGLREHVQREFPEAKIYVAKLRDVKKERIIEATRTLPADVCARRYGVTPDYVRKLSKSGR